MTISRVIVEQHAEESVFLWLLRDSAVNEPHYSLSDLTNLDERTEANIDGLRIAGDEDWEICKKTLALEDAGQIFTGAVLTFESGRADRVKDVLEAGSKELELSRGIVSGLGWLQYSWTEKFIQSYLISELPALRRIGLAACSVHRKDPGKILHDRLSSSDLFLKARALKATGELGKTDFADAVKDHLKDNDGKCRFYAAWASSLLGHMAGVPVLQKMAQTEGPFAERACCTALRRIDVAEGRDWHREISEKAHLLRIAILGAGALGDPVLVPWLIEYMSVPEMARVAGESFSMITGVDLAYEDLEGERPEGFEAGPTENPEDEDVAMDPDEDLPWPDPKLIGDWWLKNNANFKSGVRYLCGKPISDEQCQHVLRCGYQRQRAAAAIELAMMHPGTPLFNVEAPGFRQQKLLGMK
jgi:uncharacterized protein (TIGR02270 family)